MAQVQHTMLDRVLRVRAMLMFRSVLAIRTGKQPRTLRAARVHVAFHNFRLLLPPHPSAYPESCIASSSGCSPANQPSITFPDVLKGAHPRLSNETTVIRVYSRLSMVDEPSYIGLPPLPISLPVQMRIKLERELCHSSVMKETIR